MDSDETAINRLLGNKVKGHFDEEQRYLLEKNFIQTNRYEVLDKQIDAVLKEISDEREAQLREQSEKAHNVAIILPKMEIKPLPAIDFENYDQILLYIENTEREKRLKRKLIPSTGSEPKKPLDVLDLGSSSEDMDNSDDELPIVIHRKKSTLLEDSDDEQNDAQNEDNSTNAQNEGTDEDNDIQVVAEIKSETNSEMNSEANKSDETDDEDINEMISSNDKTRDKLKPKQR